MFQFVNYILGRKQLQGGHENSEAGSDALFHPGGAPALGHQHHFHDGH